MKRSIRNIPRWLFFGWAVGMFALVAIGQETSEPAVVLSDSSAATEDVDFRKRSAAEWKKLLSPRAFYVTRQHGTEPAFSHPSYKDKADGVYRCVCCQQPLFDSRHKFDSGTGWPSFFQGVDAKSIGTSADYKLGYKRVEVHCSRCDAHLGHVFADAPQTPTGLRYCINGVAIQRTDREAATP